MLFPSVLTPLSILYRTTLPGCAMTSLTAYLHLPKFIPKAGKCKLRWAARRLARQTVPQHLSIVLPRHEIDV